MKYVMNVTFPDGSTKAIKNIGYNGSMDLMDYYDQIGAEYTLEKGNSSLEETHQVPEEDELGMGVNDLEYLLEELHAWNSDLVAEERHLKECLSDPDNTFPEYVQYVKKDIAEIKEKISELKLQIAIHGVL